MTDKKLLTDTISDTLDRKRDTIPQGDDTWSICCSNSDSAAIKYMVQVVFASIVMCFSMYCIVTAESDDDKSIFWSLLSSTLAYFLDAPTIVQPTK